MQSRNLLLLHGAAQSASSALSLLEKGAIEAARQAAARARDQVQRIKEPPHSKRSRVGRSMVEHLDDLILDARLGSDATRSFNRASAAVKTALAMQELQISKQ